MERNMDHGKEYEVTWGGGEAEEECTVRVFPGSTPKPGNLGAEVLPLDHYKRKTGEEEGHVTPQRGRAELHSPKPPLWPHVRVALPASSVDLPLDRGLHLQHVYSKHRWHLLLLFS